MINFSYLKQTARSNSIRKRYWQITDLRRISRYWQHWL